MMEGSFQLANLAQAQSWFEVLQTSRNTQTAIMVLEPGRSSGERPEAHEKSEQVLLVLEGEVEAQIAGERRIIRTGDVVLIPAGVPHKFTNQSQVRALTFNTYSPPEY